MLRKESEAIPEGNGLIPLKEDSGSDQPTWRDIYRIMKEAFDRWDKKLDEISDEVRKMDQHVTSLEHGARQPRLAMEADGHANTKTQRRTEGAAEAVQAMRGDSCTAEQKVQDGPKTSITFGMDAEPPDLPCREDVLVEDGATAPKSCLPSLEMCTTTAADGLVPTGKTSTATETNFNQPPLRFCSTEETDLEANCKKNSTPYVSYDSSAFHGSNLLAAPYCRRVVETKSRQNGTFHPGGSQGHLRACPFLKSWRALVCGEVIRAGAAGDELQRLSEEIRRLSEPRSALMPCKKKSSSLERLEVMGRRNGSHVVEGDLR